MNNENIEERLRKCESRVELLDWKFDAHKAAMEKLEIESKADRAKLHDALDKLTLALDALKDSVEIKDTKRGAYFAGAAWAVGLFWTGMAAVSGAVMFIWKHLVEWLAAK